MACSGFAGRPRYLSHLDACRWELLSALASLRHLLEVGVSCVFKFHTFCPLSEAGQLCRPESVEVAQDVFTAVLDKQPPCRSPELGLRRSIFQKAEPGRPGLLLGLSRVLEDLESQGRKSHVPWGQAPSKVVSTTEKDKTVRKALEMCSHVPLRRSRFTDNRTRGWHGLLWAESQPAPGTLFSSPVDRSGPQGTALLGKKESLRLPYSKATVAKLRARRRPWDLGQNSGSVFLGSVLESLCPVAAQTFWCGNSSLLPGASCLRGSSLWLSSPTRSTLSCLSRGEVERERALVVVGVPGF